MSLQEVWDSLEGDPHRQAEGLLARRLTDDDQPAVFLGIDWLTKRRAWLLELGESSKVVPSKLPRWSGIEIDVWRGESRGADHLRITLLDREGSAVFDALIGDLNARLLPLRGSHRMAKELVACLSRWQRFFSEHGAAALSENEQHGLFGELAFIERHLQPYLSPAAAVDAWMGPAKRVHDFMLPRGAVEVKTTMMKQHEVIHISNEKQLDGRNVERLFLFHLGLEISDQSGLSLPDMVARLRERCGPDVGARVALEDRLRAAGYVDGHAPFYALRYRPSREELFRVAEGFPRIIDLPPGVGTLQYSISLDECRRHAVGLAEGLAEVTGAAHERK